MPRVKFDYIVSFSSEDPENPASNLLASNVSKKKWLCNKGEPSCSVVLQLAKAVQICTVHIGAHNSALVEVLVGRSEKPNDPFQVLVPRSVFQSAGEARRAEGAARVRSFSGAALAAPAAQRWDRVRVVCSQPYNKHCKYGLSFLHIHSPEESSQDPAPAPAAAPALAPVYSSDEETEFRPGELFAAHLHSASATTDTGAQIRQATSQALKNIADSSTKLVKTPITKLKKHPTGDDERTCRRTTDDENKNTAEIDKQNMDKNNRQKVDDRNTSRNYDRQRDDSRNATKKDDRARGDEHKPSRGSQDEGRRQKRRYSGGTKPNESSESALRAGPVSAAPHSLLRGAELVLSGYQHPRRAALRAAAAALGARVAPGYTPRCTHLICAFPNTPKLRQARAGAGERVPAARGEWLEQVARQRRMLPWQWFATEPHRRVAPPPGALAPFEECDTDDEIEKVRRKMKKRRTDGSPSGTSPASASSGESPPPGTSSRTSPTPEVTSDGSEAEFVRDERTQGAASPSGSEASTEGSRAASPLEAVEPRAALPAPFAGRTFRLAARPALRARLRRYLRAYGGTLLEDASEPADYLVGGDDVTSPDTLHVSVGWVWRCHRARRLLPPDVTPPAAP